MKFVFEIPSHTLPKNKIKMKKIKYLILATSLIFGMSFASKSQTITSYTITNNGNNTWHFKVVLDAPNPNGRGIDVEWKFAWLPGRPYRYTNGVFTLGPTGGSTYESDQNVYEWAPPSPPFFTFWGPATVPLSVSYFCSYCLNQKNKIKTQSFEITTK